MKNGKRKMENDTANKRITMKIEKGSRRPPAELQHGKHCQKGQDSKDTPSPSHTHTADAAGDEVFLGSRPFVLKVF